MKYSLLAVALLALSACGGKPDSTTLICFTPMTPLSGVQVDTSSPDVREDGKNVFLKTNDGNLVIIPRVQCVEIRKAQ